MLRGAIDLVGPTAIGGWIYSDQGPVSDRTVLAFVDDHCIGSGRIGLVREDLKAAGLGDGRFGFNFPIAIEGNADFTCIVRKLLA